MFIQTIKQTGKLKSPVIPQRRKNLLQRPYGCETIRGLSFEFSPGQISAASV
jgi:hypothetical protein